MQRQGQASNAQQAAARAQNLKDRAAQIAENSSAPAKEPEDSEQQSASTSSQEEQQSENAARQASEAPLTRARDYLSGGSYAVAGYTKPSKGIGQ